MKEKITRITKVRTDEIKLPFRIETNVNEDNSQLDISVHEMNIDPVKRVITTGPIETLKSAKTFTIRINNNLPLTSKTFGPKNEEVILRTHKLSVDILYDAIYQFSVPFRELELRDNIIVIYENNKAEDNNKIGFIEFFAETEDNFINVRLDRPGSDSTDDQVLWKAIRSNIKFSGYVHFIDKILCNNDNTTKLSYGTSKTFNRDAAKNRSPFVGGQEYNLIKFGTEFYMLAKFGLSESEILSYLGDRKMLPYYGVIVDRLTDDLRFDDITKTINDNSPDCQINEYNRLKNPFMIELIWNYWMEQAGLVQTLNIINLRFQNIKGNNVSDRLQRFDIDPLRPLSHILWGYIQDEQHRLSIPRRLNEYDHEYGLTLTGRAVPNIRPIDSRVQFLEAFHNLLNQALAYYHESDDTTRIADAFPILNSLKEVHLLLAEGNHNAYGNLTWTARQEMMMQQYILSRTEMREFLGGRTMVPYPETWMDRVDNMRNIQGWSGAGVMSYYELATHGEQILLSIRYGNWSDIDLTGNNAANWAKEFRNSIQRYVHAYRAVTGVDLSAERVQLSQNFATQPAFLIQQRMMANGNKTYQAKLPAPLFRL